jgi:hypothetical protein
MSTKDRTTKFPNGLKSFVVPRDFTEVTADKTLNATTDVGKTFVVYGKNVTITLPALSAGALYIYTIVNGRPDGDSLLSILPGTLDGISLITQVDDKKLLNTAATSKLGDYVTLSSASLGVFWVVTEIAGVWAKEP